MANSIISYMQEKNIDP